MRAFWLGLFLFVALLASPLPGLGGQARATAGVALLMATWWIAEAIPIPAASLLPLLLFPLLRVADLGRVAPNYADPVI